MAEGCHSDQLKTYKQFVSLRLCGWTPTNAVYSPSSQEESRLYEKLHKNGNNRFLRKTDQGEYMYESYEHTAIATCLAKQKGRQTAHIQVNQYTRLQDL